MRTISTIGTGIFSMVLLAVDFAVAAPGSYSGNIYDDSNGDYGNTIVIGLFAVAVLAFVVHLIERGEIFSFLRDFAKGISFVASMYLWLFCFLGVSIGLALLLQSLGVGKGVSGIIALPVGFIVVYKLTSVYVAWRGKNT